MKIEKKQLYVDINGCAESIYPCFDFIEDYFPEYSDTFVVSATPNCNKTYKYIDTYNGEEEECYFIQDLITTQTYLVHKKYCNFVDKPKENKKFIPYLQFCDTIYSGNIGERTDIVDILGNKLCLGDTVLLYENKRRITENIICKDEHNAFVMHALGKEWVKGRANKDGFTYNIIKNRSYKEIKNGEIVNDVEYILGEENKKIDFSFINRDIKKLLKERKQIQDKLDVLKNRKAILVEFDKKKKLKENK